MMSKKLIYFMVPIIIVLGMDITINRFRDRFYLENNKKCIYNNDSKIASKIDNNSYLEKKGINENCRTDLSFKFTGMDTIWHVISNEDTEINLMYNSNIESGKFKVVLIDPYNNVTNVLEQSESSGSTHNIKKGVSRIKIVGSETKGNLEMIISINENENGVDIVAVNR